MELVLWAGLPYSILVDAGGDESVHGVLCCAGKGGLLLQQNQWKRGCLLKEVCFGRYLEFLLTWQRAERRRRAGQAPRAGV